MAIRKQAFYEGAALHQLACGGGIGSLRHEPPLFIINDTLMIHLKYSTKGRSPWPFTFLPEEQALLEDRASVARLVLGLICGADGIAGISYDALRTIAAPRKVSIHVSCSRLHGEHYTVAGPDGSLDRKIAPSRWRRLLLSEDI